MDGEDDCPCGDAVIAVRLKVNLRHRSAHLDGLGMPDKFGRQILCTNKFEQSVLRVSGGEDLICRNFFAVCQNNTFGNLAFNFDTGYFRLGSNLTAEGFHGVG